MKILKTGQGFMGKIRGSYSEIRKICSLYWKYTSFGGAAWARHGRGMDAAVSKALVGVFASQKLQS